MTPQFEIQLIAVFVAVGCSLVGAFLVLRSMAMIADAISHTVLLGIVLAFFIVYDLSSPLLIIGATLMGVITVWLTESIRRTNLVSNDSAIGLVFPFLFSLAVILITRYTGAIHLDVDAVLLGELAFAPFDRLILAGKDIGAKAIYTTGCILFINLTVIIIFFKEWKLATFDPLLASLLGFMPVFLHYVMMFLVSLTAVGSFQAVGSVLVVAFMTGPPLTAYLLTDNLRIMLILSAMIALVTALLGFFVAMWFDVSIAGSMAVMTGIIFLLIILISPKRTKISV